MSITFDHDAEGMTDLEAYNYIPEESDVVGCLIAAEIAMKRYASRIDFKGATHDQWGQFIVAYHTDLNERGVSFP